MGQIRDLARPLATSDDLDPLLDRIGDARFVLLGEASHGTSEYYRWRAEITRRLIIERGFSFVAVEGDWPACFEVNRWVKEPMAASLSAREVLSRFERWPTWMWANEEVAEFVDWLQQLNLRTGRAVGFYGLDVYSLWESLDRVLAYLGDRPDDRDAALQAFRCFQPYGEDPQRYAWATTGMVPTSCEDEVVALLSDVHASSLVGEGCEGDLDAAQNAQVLVGAERYYRTMVRADNESWNVRDRHMTDTLDRLIDYHGAGAKAVVWEHNTHIGDARATDMAAHGMVNVGQLVRERHGDDGVFLVGFSGHRGSVIAADFWGAPMRGMPVPGAPRGTHEDLVERAVARPSLMVFPEDRGGPWLGQSRGHRAIGVVYSPRRDPTGNWVPTVMGDRYDALCAFDETSALHPLHLEGVQPGGERETYPWST